MFVPRYSFGRCPGFCTNNTASTGFFVFRSQNDDRSVSTVASPRMYSNSCLNLDISATAKRTVFSV